MRRSSGPASLPFVCSSFGQEDRELSQASLEEGHRGHSTEKGYWPILDGLRKIGSLQIGIAQISLIQGWGHILPRPQVHPDETGISQAGLFQIGINQVGFG